MRRLILLFLTLCLACSLFGCTKGRGAASSSDLTQKQIDRILAAEEAREAAQARK
jgi:hypothetical protein